MSKITQRLLGAGQLGSRDGNWNDEGRIVPLGDRGDGVTRQAWLPGGNTTHRNNRHQGNDVGRFLGTLFQGMVNELGTDRVRYSQFNDYGYGQRSTLRQGMAGHDVADLQAGLAAGGANIAVDGRYGNRTAAAVAMLQSMLVRAGANLTVDGTFGVSTAQAIEQVQGEAGLPVTGLPDRATMRALANLSGNATSWYPSDVVTTSNDYGARSGLTNEQRAFIGQFSDDLLHQVGQGAQVQNAFRDATGLSPTDAPEQYQLYVAGLCDRYFREQRGW